MEKKNKLPLIVGLISVILLIIAYISGSKSPRITNLWLIIAMLGMACLAISGFTEKKVFALVYPGGCAAITIYYSILWMAWYNIVPVIVWIVLLVSVILWVLPNQRSPLGKYLWIISAGLQLMYLFIGVKDMVAYQSLNVYFLVWLIIELVAIVILGLWIYNDYKVS